MSKSGYDSELLAAMKDEERYVQDRERGERRVKIERGQVWKVRFLPVHLGEQGTWFARVAKHWLFKKPITCPVHTGEGFGGSKEADCPCCRASQELNDSPDEKVSRFGWEVRGSSQWITYCIVLEKDGTEVEGNELLMPYEFAHYVNSWEELKGFWKGGSKGGKNLTSILDYRTGNDFNVTKTAKGIRLDKDDPRPIFDEEDPRFDEYIQKIEAAVKPPKVHIPTAKELEIFADKILEEGEKIGRGGSGGSGGPSRSARRVVSDEEVEGQAPAEEDAPPARTPARRPLPPAPKRPAASDEDAEGMTPAEEDDSNPELNPVPPKSRRAAPAPEPEQEEEAPAPPPRRAARAPEPQAEEGAAEEDAPPPPRRGNPPPLPKIGPKRVAPIAPADKIDDDPEEVPEEATDSAPPVKKPLAKAVAAPPEEPAEDEPAPPPTTRKLGTNIRDKIRSVSQRDA